MAEPAPETIGDQLGRRRDAALRMVPLADGRRDPLLERSRSKCKVCGASAGRAVQIAEFPWGSLCRDRLDCYQRWRLQGTAR